MVNHERLARRVHGRKEAEAVLGLTSLRHRDEIESFLEELKEKLLPEVVQAERKEYQQRLSELKAYVLQFGQHSGKCLDDIPRDYLYWLLESSEVIVTNLSQYLKLTEDK